MLSCKCCADAFFVLLLLSFGTSAWCSASVDKTVVLQARAARRMYSASDSTSRSRRLNSTAVVASGPEFVAALGDPTVILIHIKKYATLDLGLSQWTASGLALPLVLSRNLTVQGEAPLQLDDWPVLDFNNVQGVIHVENGVELTVRNLMAVRFRRNPTRTPGVDALVPTPPGRPSMFVADNVRFVFDLCFPAEIQQIDFSMLPRPNEYPGAQKLEYDALQTGCSSDTNAPPRRRCWRSKAVVMDLAGFGANYDPLTDATTLTNMIFHFYNSSLLCGALVDLRCLQVNAPLVCFLEAERALKDSVWPHQDFSPTQLSPTEVPPPAALAAESAATAPGSTGAGSYGSGYIAKKVPTDGRLTESSRVIVICVTSIAGAFLLAGAAWLAVRWRRRCGHRVIAWVMKRGAAKARWTNPLGDDDSPQQQWPGLQADGTEQGAHQQRVGLKAAHHADQQMRCKCAEDSVITTAMELLPATTSGVSLECGDMATVSVVDSSAVTHAASDLPVTSLTPRRPGMALQVHITDGREETTDTGGTDTPSHCRGGNGNGTGSTQGIGGDPDDAAETPPPLPPSTVTLLAVVRGKGNFGRVVEGMYEGQRVAVKLLTWEAPAGDMGGGEQAKSSAGDGGSLDYIGKTFLQEVEVLSRCQHPNIVQLLAACVTPPRLCLVMELMEMSLERLLYGNPSEPRIPLRKVLHIGISIARALAYLHPTIVHRDLKPANVLINNATSDKPVVKLTDFGLSRLRSTAVASTKHPDAGTPAYIAPECYDVENRHVFHKSDMYSLGVLLWEMLTGKHPWEGYGPVAIAVKVTYKGSRLSLKDLDPVRCPPKLLRLLIECWDADPTRRPAAAEVAKVLTVILEQTK